MIGIAGGGEGAVAVPRNLGPGRAILVFLAYYGGQILAGVVVGVIVALLYVDFKGGNEAQIASQVQELVVIPASLAGVMVGGAVAFVITRRILPGSLQSGALRSIGWKKASARDLMVAIVAGLGLSVIYLYGLSAASPPRPEQEWGPLVTAASSGGWPRHWWAILLVLVAPPVEEFVFRGVMFTGFSNSWTSRSAAILMIALFVGVHVPEVRGYGPALVAVALVGAATLLARLTTQSLAPAVALHASYNLGLVIATYGGAA